MTSKQLDTRLDEPAIFCPPKRATVEFAKRDRPDASYLTPKLSSNEP
jgi:hypothetical protein